jgi:hypothetical protein
MTRSQHTLLTCAANTGGAWYLVGASRRARVIRALVASGLLEQRPPYNITERGRIVLSVANRTRKF